MASISQREFSEALDRLTTQQREVLSRVLAGEADLHIAASLGIKQATVRKHVERIYRVFDINSESNDRRSKRGDLFAIFAKHKPDSLGVTAAVHTEQFTKDENDFQLTLSNPFVPLTGVIDNPKLFFNRKREISRIFDILSSGSSVAVIGERGIGKSSLLKAICRQVEIDKSLSRQPVYLNLQLFKDQDDFYSALCDEVNIEAPLRGYQLVRALRNRPLLLALDEVENLAAFTPEIRSQLRGLAEGSKAPVRIVLASTQSLDCLFLDEGLTSPLANICIEENLTVWDDKAVRDFIDDRLNYTDVTFIESDVSQLIEKSQGHPQQLMQLCYQTYERYTEEKP